MTTERQAAFEQSASITRSAGDITGIASALRSGAEGPFAIDLAAALARVAFAEPEKLARTYDAAVLGWFGAPVTGAVIDPPAFADTAPPSDLWPDFWRLVEDSSGGIGALEITPRTAMLGGHCPPAFAPRLGAACNAYPGVVEAAATGFPPRFELSDLAACPDGSLGRRFHSQIVDNGFDLEVLDRDALALASLPAPHDYINARMLQTHDLIHLTAGYHLTSLHEIGISAFQLAQCGHGYSAMFLSVVTATAATSPQSAALVFLLDVILGAWAHGRATPPMLGIPWETVWHLPIEAVRAQFGVTPFASPYPADIIEQLRPVAA